jgi:hypothetical protein
VREHSERALRGIGYDAEAARIIADHAIDAALCGYEYSGLAKLLKISEHRRFKRPRSAMKVLRETEPSTLYNGGNNVGMLAMYHAARAHQGIMGRRRADHPLRGELAQTMFQSSWKPLRSRLIDMWLNISWWGPRLGRNHPVIRVASAEWLFAADDQAGGGDDRNTSLGQRRALYPRRGRKTRAFELGIASCRRRR